MNEKPPKKQRKAWVVIKEIRTPEAARTAYFKNPRPLKSGKKTWDEGRNWTTREAEGKRFLKEETALKHAKKWDQYLQQQKETRMRRAKSWTETQKHSQKMTTVICRLM